MSALITSAINILQNASTGKSMHFVYFMYYGLHDHILILYYSLFDIGAIEDFSQQCPATVEVPRNLYQAWITDEETRIGGVFYNRTNGIYIKKNKEFQEKFGAHAVAAIHPQEQPQPQPTIGSKRGRPQVLNFREVGILLTIEKMLIHPR
jgi:hypothetical protein